MKEKVGQPKAEFTPVEYDAELVKAVTELTETKIKEANRIKDKAEHYAAIDAIKVEAVLEFL